MCGIAGYFGPKSKGPKKNNVSNCMAMMDRRGPDHKGSYEYDFDDNTVLLLHSRLSIIDPLPEGNQPFIGNDIVISFNGEIYNYIEKREEFKNNGVKLTTKTDTEVLVRTLEQKGIKGLESLEGMWAFSAFNIKEKSLTLCRDGFGEKPLYYFIDQNKSFYFSSNINYIFALLGSVNRVNDEKILKYLYLGYQGMHEGDDTFFSEIKTLSSNQYMTIDSDLLVKTDSVNSLNKEVDHGLSYNESVSIVRDSCIKAFEGAYRADVPIASLLSGGIDSTVIGALAESMFNCDMHYFTISAKSKWYDESHLIQKTVNKYKMKHSYIDVESDSSIGLLQDLISDTASVLPSNTSLLFALLNKEIKSLNYKVLLTGNGGDELFAGYYTHHLDYLVDAYGKDHFDLSYSNWKEHITPFIRNKSLKNFPEYLDVVSNDLIRYDNHEDRQYYRNEFHEFGKKECTSKFEEYPHLRRSLLMDLFERTIPAQIVTSDAVSMYFSIENRAPFLSFSLLNSVLSIPSKHLINNGFGKALLRDAFKDLLPDEIYNEREKLGFNMSITDLINFNNPKVFDLMRNCELIDRHFNITKIIEDLSIKPMSNTFSKLIFRLINVAMFMEKYERI